MRFNRSALFQVIGTVAAGAVLSTAALALEKDEGSVKATGHPHEAAVFINGSYMGPAYRFTVPEEYVSKAGEIEVSIKDPRYEDYTTRITVRPRKTARVRYALKKLPVPQPPFGRFRLKGGEQESYVSVVGDTGAVYLNDKYVGHVDELDNAGGGLLLNPGTYDLHVSSPLFGEIRQKITIEANKLTVVQLPNRN